MALVGGYTVFLPGNWKVPDFLFSYLMIGLVPALFVFYKIYRRSEVSIEIISLKEILNFSVVAKARNDDFL